MSRNFILVEEAFAEWRKDPAYVAAYEALEEEFALADLQRLIADARASGVSGQSVTEILADAKRTAKDVRLGKPE